MRLPNVGWLDPRLEGKTCEDKGGRAVFARAHVAAGCVVSVWGGIEVSGPELAGFPQLRRLAVQVGEDRYLLSVHEGPEDWINHSCDPNVGLVGDITLVALRDILPGEEVTYDYAMTDGSPYDEFNCSCASPLCRGCVRGSDWERVDLRARYQGHFSSYLEWRWRTRGRSVAV